MNQDKAKLKIIRPDKKTITRQSLPYFVECHFDPNKYMEMWFKKLEVGTFLLFK